MGLGWGLGLAGGRSLGWVGRGWAGLVLRGTWLGWGTGLERGGAGQGEGGGFLGRLCGGGLFPVLNNSLHLAYQWTSYRFLLKIAC